MAIIYSYPLADEVTNDSWVLGSEMDNGSRVVKNYSVGDLVSFTRGFVTLSDVLDNNNNSLLNANISQLGLYDSNMGDYGLLTLNSNVFEVVEATGNTILNIDNCYLTMYQNGGGNYATIFFTGAANRNYELPDANGTIALTDDLLDYVPYTGATGSINIGSNDIYTSGGAKLADDGTLYGTELFLYDGPNAGYAVISIADDYFAVRRSSGNEMFACDNGSFLILKNAANGTAIISNPHSTQRVYILPDDEGTFALTKYKVYVAIVTQSGSTNPVATVLENTIGAITITRGGTGQYTINSSGLFEIGKTTFDLTPIQGFIKQGAISNPSAIVFETRDNSNANADGLLTSKKLEIRVYN